MTLLEAARQALEALEQLQGGCTDSDDGTVEAITVWFPEVIDALRQAIEQAEQAQPLTDEVTQIADALRRHGLTLVKTANGYDVINLGQITAHGIREKA